VSLRDKMGPPHHPLLAALSELASLSVMHPLVTYCTQADEVVTDKGQVRILLQWIDVVHSVGRRTASVPLALLA